jgi:hypothetical protein
MKLNNIKRIIEEDFPQDDRLLIRKLSFSLNPFLEQISTLFNKNIDFDNLNQEFITVTVELNAAGIPKTQIDIKTTLKTRIKGCHCINSRNLTNDGTFPSGNPFISFTPTGNLLRINHVAGLPADKKYELSVILIG